MRNMKIITLSENNFTVPIIRLKGQNNIYHENKNQQKLAMAN